MKRTGGLVLVGLGLALGLGGPAAGQSRTRSAVVLHYPADKQDTCRVKTIPETVYANRGDSIEWELRALPPCRSGVVLAIAMKSTSVGTACKVGTAAGDDFSADAQAARPKLTVRAAGAKTCEYNVVFDGTVVEDPRIEIW